MNANIKECAGTYVFGSLVTVSLSLVIGLNNALSVKDEAVAPQTMTSDVSQFKNIKTG